LLVTAGDEQVRIWRMSSVARLVRAINAASCTSPQSTAAPALDSAVFSHDARFVVTADRDGAACIWNTGTGRLVRKFIEPAGVSGSLGGRIGGGSSALRWAVFSPGGRQVLTASNDGTARIWDVRTGRQLQVVSEPTGGAINHASFSPTGRLLVTASDDGTADIWSVASGRLQQTLSAPGGNPVYNAAFSHSGRSILTCSGSSAVIWSRAGQHLTEFQYGNTFSDCEFSPDGREVVTAGSDGNTRIFSTELTGSLSQIERISDQRLTQLSAAERKEYLGYLRNT
jgi:WD40 repeat protein